MHIKQLLIGVVLSVILVGCNNTPTVVTPEVLTPQEETFQLGRRLFYDSRLSADNTISCGSCHQQAAAFAHAGHPVSHGVGDANGMRNSPPIQNMAERKFFFWDGGVLDLMLVPLNAIQNPVEMNTSMQTIVEKLQSFPEYQTRFKKAFGSDTITGQRVLYALHAFNAELLSSNSRYDSIQRKQATFTALENNGSKIFARICAQCHTEGAFASDEFSNNGFIPEGINDLGRATITLNPSDNYKFRIPSLRNAAYTAPYMHDGSIRTLRGAIEHYRNIVPNEYTDKRLLNPEFAQLTNADVDALLAFIQTLSDKKFITNPRFSEVAP